MGFFRKKVKLPDSEFDIEGEDVFCIDREYNTTNIGFYPKDGGAHIEWTFITPIEKHNEYIKRFRVKKYKEKQFKSELEDDNDESLEDYLQG